VSFCDPTGRAYLRDIEGLTGLPMQIVGAPPAAIPMASRPRSRTVNAVDDAGHGPGLPPDRHEAAGRTRLSLGAEHVLAPRWVDLRQ